MAEDEVKKYTPSTYQPGQSTDFVIHEDVQEEPENVKFFARYGGMLMALLASLFFSLSFLIIKILGGHYGFQAYGSAVLFNCGVIVPCVFAICFHEIGPGCKDRPRIFSEIWPLNTRVKKTKFAILIVQGISQGLSVILRSYSLRYLSIGDMTVIVFSSPVVTNLIAHFLVGEQCGLFFVFTAILTLGGVALVTKPPIITGEDSFDSDTLIGFGLAFAAMLCLSFKFAVTRKIKGVHFLLMTLFLGTGGLLISLPLYLTFEDLSSIHPKGIEDTLLVLGLFSAFVSIACINLALKLEDAGPVALIRSCDVIFAFLLQFLFLNVIPDIWSAIGAIIVVTGVVLTAIRKRLIKPKREPKDTILLSNDCK